MIRWYGNVKESKCFNNTLWNFYLLLYNIWSEYHVLFCIVFCSMLFCKVTIVTCFHQTTKCQPSEPLSIDIMPEWIKYLPVKLSVGILPLPLPRRVEIEARGVGYWIFRGSSGHFDHSTILTSTIPATKLFYLRWGAQGMENIHK